MAAPQRYGSRRENAQAAFDRFQHQASTLTFTVASRDYRHVREAEIPPELVEILRAHIQEFGVAPYDLRHAALSAEGADRTDRAGTSVEVLWPGLRDTKTTFGERRR